MLLIINKYTIIGYNINYAFFIQIISIIKNTKTLRITNSSIINNANRSESYILFEFFLGLGRVLGFILLLLVGILKNMLLLKVFVIVLSFCILLMSRHLLKINNYE